MPETLGQIAPSRHIPLEGTFNLRDIGGYETAVGGETRWRTFFRADSLHRLPESAQEELLELGVRTIVDLRRDHEVRRWPNVFATSSELHYERVDLAPEGGVAEVTDSPLESTYRAILSQRQPEIRQIFSLLAQPDRLPVVIHCTAGKDRTGLIIALLLGLAEVDHDTIATDYGLSAEYLREEYFAEARERAALAGIPWERYQLNLVCPPEYMSRTLAHMGERFGSAEQYLQSAGLTQAELTSLRLALIQSDVCRVSHAG